MTLLGVVPLDQNPEVPVSPEVISPLQVKAPVVPLIVQPVEEDPPAILTVEAASAMFKVETLLDNRLKVEAVDVKSPPLTDKSSDKVKVEALILVVDNPPLATVKPVVVNDPPTPKLPVKLPVPATDNL